MKMERVVAMAVGCCLAVGCGAAEQALEKEVTAAKDTMPQGELVKYLVAPMFQAVELKLDPDRKDYSGSVRIDLKVSKPTKTLAFFAEEMTLDRLELKGEQGAVAVTVETGEAGMQKATAETELAPGAYTLGIDFHKDFNTQAVGLYRMEAEGRGYLFTQLEAVDARKAFPCWDEPRYKIPFQLTLQLPEAQQAVTSTPVESEKAGEAGWKTLVFAKTKPLPSYLVAIAAGRLESVPIEGMSVPGRVYTIAGQSHLAGMAAEVTPPILSALEKYFGRPYPYQKLDLIAVPEYWPGAMENPGLVTFADRLLLIDPKSASTRQKALLAGVTAHELAHMWFGDLVTMRWWDDLWLNESFASWMGDKVTQELFPQYQRNVSVVREVQSLMERDARPSTKPIRKPVVTKADIEEDFGLAYEKGQTVLTMFERWLGAETFRKGVLQYLDDHAWGNATAADLWSALSTASGKDVGKAMSGFLTQAGYPLVSVTAGPKGSVKLEQRRFLSDGVTAPEQSWIVPVGLKYSGGDKTATKTVLLASKSQTVELERGGKIAWVMPNAGAYGYYRWQVPPEMLSRLADEAPKVMDERERVGFLGNAGSLLDAGVIGGDQYLKILNAFAADPEPEVISSVMESLEKVQLSFVPDDLREAFGVYVRKTLGPALQRFGLEAKEGEHEAVSLFRPRLILWLGIEGKDPEILRLSAALAHKHLTDPASVDPSLADAVLRVAAAGGDRKLFEAYQAAFEKVQVPAVRSRYLAAMGSFEDPKIQDEALKYSLSGPLRANEIFSVVRSFPETEAGRDRTFQWVTGNYDAIVKRIPPEFAVFMTFIGSGCSEDRLERTREFFSKPEHQAEGTESRLQKVADQVNDCLRLRRREGSAVTAYLKALPEKVAVR